MELKLEFLNEIGGFQLPEDIIWGSDSEAAIVSSIKMVRFYK